MDQSSHAQQPVVENHPVQNQSTVPVYHAEQSQTVPAYDASVNPAQEYYAPEKQTEFTAGAAPAQQQPPQAAASQPPALPPRHPYIASLQDEDNSSPVHYTRDPHVLVGYLVPFPTPSHLSGNADPTKIPPRFLIYTPPPPPLVKPPEGVKEAKVHMLQRKWQEEVRAAKQSDAKVASWKGVKSRATKGINVAIGWTKTSNLEFLNRFPTGKGPDGSKLSDSPDSKDAEHDAHVDDGVHEHDTTSKTVGLTDMVLVHPATMPGNEQQIREEFVNTMLRTKSKAQRDAIIATGLMPVAYGIDILATLIWPFGGLGEIDTVWAYASLRGAKTARSVTKRLASSSDSDHPEKDEKNKLRLTFTPSKRLDILSRMLAAECHRRDRRKFGATGQSEVTDSEALTAIGWHPSQTGGQAKNWEDEQWEVEQVKEDLRSVFRKGAREWDKFVSAYEKDPEKAMKK